MKILINSRFSTEKTLIPAPINSTPQITKHPQTNVANNTKTFINVQAILSLINENIIIKRDGQFNITEKSLHL